MNPFRIFLTGAHLVSFCYSPLDDKRLKAEYNDRVDRDFVRNVKFEVHSTANENDDCENNEEILRPQIDWLKSIINLPNLIRLIKRYHMAGNLFIFLAVFHILVLFHLSIKCLLHSILVGRDHNRMEYFDTIYYPHLTAVYPEFQQFNTLFLFIASYNLVLRLCYAYKLIRRSIINEHTYKEVSIDQVTIACVTVYDATIKNWIKFWSYSIEHEKKVKLNPNVMVNHLKFNQNIHRRVKTSSQFDLLYRMNAIDFDECYASCSNIFEGRHKKAFKQWHCPSPVMRFDLNIVRYGFVAIIIANIILVVTVTTCIIGYIYLEVANLTAHNEQHRQVKVVVVVEEEQQQLLRSSKWTFLGLELFRLLRIVEVSLFVLIQVPQHASGVLFIISALALISRNKKLRLNMQRDLDICLDSLKSSIMIAELPSRLSIQPLNFSHDFREPIKFSQSEQSFTDYRSSKQNYEIFEMGLGQARLHDRRNLNDRIQRQVNLIRLIYLEFLDLKKNNNVYLNILFISQGVCISYILSLFFAVESKAELVLLGGLILSGMLPVCSTLFTSAWIEQEVSLILLTFSQTIL